MIINMHWKIREWTKRYLPAEITASLLAIFGSGICFAVTNNNILTAIAGTWSENIGYYGTIIFRDYLDLKKKNNYHLIIKLVKFARNLIMEFGLAEILDSFFVRPSCMYFFPVMLNNLPFGILLGKISADAIFYLPTVMSYELRKKYIK